MARIIGVFPGTKEVLVKDDKGKVTRRPATPEQIEQAEKTTRDIGAMEAPRKAVEYEPPERQPSEIIGASPYTGKVVIRKATGEQEVVTTKPEVAKQAAKFIELQEKNIITRKDGKFQIDIAAARSAGTTLKELERMGILATDVARATKQRREYYKLEALLRDLKDYKEADGYDLAKYLKEHPSKASQLSVAFDVEDIREAQQYNKQLADKAIKEKPERIGAIIPKKATWDIKPKIPVVSARVTPKTKPKNLESLGATGALIAALPVATATPFPHDDIAIYLILGGIAAYTAVNAAIQSLKGVDIPKEISSAVSDFRSKFGRSPSADDIIIVDKAGMASTLTELAPELVQLPPLKPRAYMPKMERYPMTKELPIQEQIRVADIEKWQEVIKGIEPEIVFLPTPMVSREKIMGKAGTMLATEAGANAAAQQLRKTITVEINWNKILAEAERAKRKEEIDKAFASISQSMQKQSPDIAKYYRQAYEDYIRKKLLLEAARREYIASLNPKPLKGGMEFEPSTMASIASATMPKIFGMPTSKVRSVLANATRVAFEAKTNALAKGLTMTRAMELSQTATQTFVANAIEPLVQAKTLTQAQARALTHALTNTATTAATATTVAEATTAATDALTTTTTLIPPIIPKLFSGASDKEKRRYIRKVGGAIAWRQGELGGRDIWHVIVRPYEQKDYFTLAGKKPAGATIVRGKESAYRTAQLLRGITISRPKTIDMGMMDVKLQPISGRKGVRISFEPDPKLQTTGDIDISKRKGVFPLGKPED